MNDTICLVTGANTGIGLETARTLASRGATVVMSGRDAARLERAVGEVSRSAPAGRVEPLVCDLASMRSVRDAAEQFRARHARLDLLVNNAGLFLSDRRITEDGFESTMGINHLGHFLLTHLLCDRLFASPAARVVNVASNAHRAAKKFDPDDLHAERRPYGGVRAYAESKLANVLYTRELARRWSGRGIRVNAVHPGVVNTRISADGDGRGIVRWLWDLGRPFMLTPADGAKTTIHVATSEEGGSVSGRYFAKSAQVNPSRHALDDLLAARLWDASERAVGVSASHEG
jgi:NAD(P)-dependent dehydrogenase (short-subunit alcohol dehydrogenase family)